MNETLLKQVDIGLLITFAVIYRERSVSRAAQCLGLGQPAVSMALSRLRGIFDDNLFIRSRTLRPTQKAILINAKLLPILSSLEDILDSFSVCDRS